MDAEEWEALVTTLAASLRQPLADVWAATAQALAFTTNPLTPLDQGLARQQILSSPLLMFEIGSGMDAAADRALASIAGTAAGLDDAVTRLAHELKRFLRARILEGVGGGDLARETGGVASEMATRAGRDVGNVGIAWAAATLGYTGTVHTSGSSCPLCRERRGRIVRHGDPTPSWHAGCDCYVVWAPAERGVGGVPAPENAGGVG